MDSSGVTGGGMHGVEFSDDLQSVGLNVQW